MNEQIKPVNPVDYAINHDPDCVAMHQANHPQPDIEAELMETFEAKYAPPKEPTPRAFELRRVLEEKGDWMKSTFIYEAMKNGPFSYTWPLGTKFVGTVGKEIQEDVRSLNYSGAFQSIIVSSKAKGYKIATKEEFDRYSANAIRSHRKSLYELSLLRKRASLDGQGMILFTHSADQTGEIGFHDVFPKNNESRGSAK